jgi:hypothetical protein
MSSPADFPPASDALANAIVRQTAVLLHTDDSSPSPLFSETTRKTIVEELEMLKNYYAEDATYQGARPLLEALILAAKRLGVDA